MIQLSIIIGGCLVYYTILLLLCNYIDARNKRIIYKYKHSQK